MNKKGCKILISIVAVSFLLSCATNNTINNTADYYGAYNDESLYYDQNGGFSISVPESWQISDFPGLKFRILRGPIEHNFGLNIVFSDEIFNGDLKTYIDLSIDNIIQAYSDIGPIQRTDFITEQNIRGEKLVYTIMQNGILYRLKQYVLPGKDNVFMIISCGVPDSIGEKYDSLFDRTAKTFMWTD